MVGLNHQAIVDYQQMRLVCMAMEELGKTPDERGGGMVSADSRKDPPEIYFRLGEAEARGIG